jgi:hypothetical protein
MPRWPDEMLDCCFFVFDSEEDARLGHPSGGCGFFISVPWESNPAAKHVYAVTCKHVAPEKNDRSILSNRFCNREPRTFVESHEVLISCVIYYVV